MGLAEKRAVQDFQNNKFDGWKKQICAAAGFEPKFQIAWETMAQDGYAHLFEEGFQKIYFQPLVNAFTEVCKDQMGKDAVKTSLKEIRICNKSGHYSPRPAINFENGILTIDHEPTTNMQDIDDRTKQIITVLENAL